jgi:DNA primase
MSTFELLRDRVPIEEVVSHHSEVKANKAHCVAPDHPDANPSMHLYGDHVHCFACDFHGDVTDVHAAIEGFSRAIEAALDLARKFGVELPEWDPEARRKIQERREKEDSYSKQAWACHRTLDGYPNVREWWEKRGFGQELRQRFLLGANEDGTAATIPYWRRGRVQCLIERFLRGKSKYLLPVSEKLPDGYKPLFIPGPLKGEVFLVEGFIDALAVAALGESVVAIGGTGISREQMRELERIPSSLYILPDSDEEGAEAAHEWVRKLYPKGLLCPAEYSVGASHA